MNSGRFKTKNEIISEVKTMMGKSFGEFSNHISDDNKGSLGILVEEEGFGYGANSDSAPDFSDAKIELKVTPYKKLNNGEYSSKERLVLNIINYEKEYKYDFNNSSFWSKSENLLILFYLFKQGVSKKDLIITHYLHHNFTEEDLLIVKNDWEIIKNKILIGEAHNISESDTMYLAACTKGANNLSVRTQPFSNKLAKQRAFSLKTTYMTQILRKLLKSKSNETLVTAENLRKMTFEEVLVSKVKSFYNMTDDALMKRFSIKTSAKNKHSIIVSKILNTTNIEKTDEFLKANIKVKTIRIQKNGKMKESMSFPAFKFEEITHQEFEESDLFNLFNMTKFMFVIFKEVADYYIFDKVIFWNMPMNLIDIQVREVWNHTKSIISSGNIVKEFGKNKRPTNFWTKKNGNIIHVRPHATTIRDTYPLPVRDKLTGANEYMKHCFWLNNDYILTII